MNGLSYIVVLLLVTMIITRAVGYFQALKFYFYSRAITILVALVHKAQRYDMEGKNDLKPLERFLSRFYPYVDGKLPLEKLDRETLFNLTFSSPILNSKQNAISFLEGLPAPLKGVVNDMLNCIYAAYHTRSFLHFIYALLRQSSSQRSPIGNTSGLSLRDLLTSASSLFRKESTIF